MNAPHLEWTAQHTLRMLDQTRLPAEERWVEASTYQEVADAIRSMVVRGAPLIGVVAAFGLAMAAERSLDELPAAAQALRATRPTAVNLTWAIDRMLAFAGRHPDPAAIAGEAERIADEDAEMSRQMGRYGGVLLP